MSDLTPVRERDERAWKLLGLMLCLGSALVTTLLLVKVVPMVFSLLGAALIWAAGL